MSSSEDRKADRDIPQTPRSWASEHRTLGEHLKKARRWIAWFGGVMSSDLQRRLRRAYPKISLNAMRRPARSGVSRTSPAACDSDAWSARRPPAVRR